MERIPRPLLRPGSCPAEDGLQPTEKAYSAFYSRVARSSIAPQAPPRSTVSCGVLFSRTSVSGFAG
jgi:hypothetical protein